MKQIAIIIVFLFSAVVHAQSSCGLTTQGGPDVFPWSLAQPFPWDDVQGLWKVSDQPDNVLKIKVVRQNQKVKHLNIEVLSRVQCAPPLMKGVGLITASEKNVVRINLVDSEGFPKLMKLAFFDASDLKIMDNSCGETILAASVIDIGNEVKDDSHVVYVTKSNMMLKKITSSLDFYCRKPRNQ